MIGDQRSHQQVGHGLIESQTGALRQSEVDNLWRIFGKIVDSWGDKGSGMNSPEDYYGQWYEFVALNTAQSPSYLQEYRSGISVLNELEGMYQDEVFELLLMENGLNLYFNSRKEEETDRPDRALRIGHLKLYVVDEFIDVFLASGGHREFGALNYNSFIYRSRFSGVG